MTNQQIKHVEEQLISFIDRVAAEKEKAASGRDCGSA